MTKIYHEPHFILTRSEYNDLVSRAVSDSEAAAHQRKCHDTLLDYVRTLGAINQELCPKGCSPNEDQANRLQAAFDVVMNLVFSLDTAAAAKKLSAPNQK